MTKFEDGYCIVRFQSPGTQAVDKRTAIIWVRDGEDIKARGLSYVKSQSQSGRRYRMTSCDLYPARV